MDGFLGYQGLMEHWACHHTTRCWKAAYHGIGDVKKKNASFFVRILKF